MGRRAPAMSQARRRARGFVAGSRSKGGEVMSLLGASPSKKPGAPAYREARGCTRTAARGAGVVLERRARRLGVAEVASMRAGGFVSALEGGARPDAPYVEEALEPRLSGVGGGGRRDQPFSQLAMRAAHRASSARGSASTCTRARIVAGDLSTMRHVTVASACAVTRRGSRSRTRDQRSWVEASLDSTRSACVTRLRRSLGLRRVKLPSRRWRRSGRRAFSAEVASGRLCGSRPRPRQGRVACHDPMRCGEPPARVTSRRLSVESAGSVAGQPARRRFDHRPFRLHLLRSRRLI